MEKNIQIKSSDFDSSKPHQLLLEINEDSYSYALVDENNALKMIGNSTSDIEQAEFAGYAFSIIKISYFSKSFSIVPSNFENDIQSFKNLMEINPDEETFLTTSLNADAIAVYTINIQTQQTLYDLFTDFQIFPQISPLLKGSKENGFYINIKGSYAEVLLIKNNTLNFYNVFEFKSDNELQYFLVLALQQKAIDGKKETVYISGDISESSLTFQRVKTLIPHLTLRKPGTEIKINDDFNEIELEQYFTLINLASCEL